MENARSHVHDESVIDDVVSTLNNYIETHSYLFDGEYFGSPSDIVSNYGFGYVEGDDRILHWVEGGDIEVCTLKLDEVRTILNDGLTDKTMVRIMEQCI
jgi:hypothetical protein